DLDVPELLEPALLEARDLEDPLPLERPLAWHQLSDHGNRAVLATDVGEGLLVGGELGVLARHHPQHQRAIRPLDGLTLHRVEPVERHPATTPSGAAASTTTAIRFQWVRATGGSSVQSRSHGWVVLVRSG